MIPVDLNPSGTVTYSLSSISWQLSGTVTGQVRHLYPPNAGPNRVRVLSTDELLDLDLACPPLQQVESGLIAPSTTAQHHPSSTTLARCCAHSSSTILKPKPLPGKLNRRHGPQRLPSPGGLLPPGIHWHPPSQDAATTCSCSTARYRIRSATLTVQSAELFGHLVQVASTLPASLRYAISR